MNTINTIARDEARSYPTYPLSIRRDFKKKDHNGVNTAKNWKPADMSAIDLAVHVSQGYPIAVSVYKGNYRHQDNAITTRLIGLDFDDKGLPFTAEMAAEHPLISKIAAVILPTASDRPDAPRCRALCFLDRSIDADEMQRLKAVFMNLFVEYDLDRLNFDTARMFYGSEPDPSRVFVAPYNVLQVDEFLAEYAELAIPAETERKGTRSKGKAKSTSTKTDSDIKAELDALIKAGGEALVDFEPVSFTGAYAPILDQLQYVVRLWCFGEPSYDLWLRMWIGAYRASNGADEVRDYIINCEPVWAKYSDPRSEQTEFENAWAGLQERDEDAITGATLAWMAREVGWGSHNPYGRLTDADIVIDVVELSDGLDWNSVERGQNVAIKSQTGSGKTKGNVALIRRFQPTRNEAVVVSPFIALCHAVATSLNRQDIVAISYDEKRVDNSGGIVVRTPQNTLKHLPDPERLSYVFIEEIHALLQHLTKTKGEGGHMRDDERLGFREWLVKALRCPTCTVVMVDAGLTDVSVSYLRSIAPVTVIHNKGRRAKQPVTRVDEHYAIERAIEMLKTGKKVVVTAPGARGCKRLYRILAPYAESSVLIIADTKEEQATRDFRSDVEAGAARTQLVVYNGAMGTGVSIEHTTPDLVIQYIDYLTASAWIQHLNRYRNQKEVLLVFSNRLAKRHPRKTYADLKGNYVATWREEIKAQGFRPRDIASKSPETIAFDRLKVGLEADLAAQSVDCVLYYEKVLEEDGRLYFDEVEIERVHPAMTDALKLIREKDKEVMRTWREVQPIDPKTPVEVEMSAEDLAKGYLHHRLTRLTFGYLPENVDNEVIAETLLNHATTIRDLEGSMNDEADTRGVEIALNPTRGYTELRPIAAKRTLVQTSRTLLQGLFDEITPENLRENAALYVAQIEQLRAAYDVIVERPRNKFAAVAERCEGNVEDMATTLLKYVLESVGLKLKSRRSQPRKADGTRETRYAYYIENAQEAYNAMLWRERGRTRNADLEHIRSTFGLSSYDLELKTQLEQINRQPEMLRKFTKSLSEGSDIWEAIVITLHGDEVPF